jgi:NAD+ diphosphatase
MPLLERLDRAGHLRKDTDRLLGALDAPTTLLVPTWRNQTFVSPEGDALALPEVASSGTLIDRAGEIAWLGQLEGRDCFAVDLSELEDPMQGVLSGIGTFADLRIVGGRLTPAEAEIAAYALGLLRWHRHNRHCGLCGGRTEPKEGGHVRICPTDGERFFPRTDPAVMVLVQHGGRCVLARQHGWPEGMYSIIAGFVEPGETLEEAAARETFEELGLQIDNLRYFRSQPWPFPASLMTGFIAEATSDAIRLDSEELETARWFTREDLANPRGFYYPPAYSLAHHMIAAFLSTPSRTT